MLDSTALMAQSSAHLFGFADVSSTGGPGSDSKSISGYVSQWYCCIMEFDVSQATMTFVSAETEHLSFRGDALVLYLRRVTSWGRWALGSPLWLC